MGFSVSASAAIIFISFLLAASTLYAAWDNSYSNVRAAQDDWYELKVSRLNTLLGLNASLGSVSWGSGYYNLTLYVQNSGETQYLPHWSGVYDGDYVTLYNISDDNVGWAENYTYLLPGETANLNVTNVGEDGKLHNLTIIFANGCWLRLSWHYNGTAVLLDGQSRGCPTEVS
ncbi:flagella [Thermococcus sp. 21S7]|uniref:flagella n=1 Tax=Thermococcus sp. 21S7 TaxID=1638221 RepID=UPI00143A4DD2|nr:flagella [Thermococcus sp. 21S7]NJE60323.1 flagella [Thermococcus sp. 21S7]